MTFKKWLVGTPDRQLAKNLAEECDIDPFVALIASVRGYSDPSEIEQLVSSELCFCDPYELIDIEKAAEAVNTATTAEELSHKIKNTKERINK